MPSTPGRSSSSSPAKKATKSINSHKRVGKKPPKKVSLLSLKSQTRATVGPMRSSTRKRKSVVRSYVLTESQLKEFDEQEGILDPGVDQDDLDDSDYLQSVPGRPAKFNNTFMAVYGPISSFSFSSGHYTVTCGEPICLMRTRQMLLNSKWQDISIRYTPPKKLAKPPVCHKTSWAALEVEMLDQERLNKKLFTDNFRKRVCWEPSNLGPGHAACNSAGEKVKAGTAHTEKKAAQEVITLVMKKFNRNGWRIWQ